MSYVVRVNFPDDDMFCFLKNETGPYKDQVKQFYCQSEAETEAQKYSSQGAVVLELKKDE